MNRIVYLMGKSASGKDTIHKKLRELYPQFTHVILYTTRPAREGEIHGREYFFISEGETERLLQDGKIIELREYPTVRGLWKYMTVDDGQIDLSKESCLMIGTLESYEKMKTYFGEEAMLPVYVEVDDGLRLMRSIERERMQNSPNYAEICRRFLADGEDFKEENLKHAGIRQRFNNESLEDCIQEIRLYIDRNL